MFIVAIIAKGLLARGLSQKAAGPLSWIITIATGMLLVFCGWQLVKHSIIKAHDAEQEAAVTKEQLARTHEADAADTARERADQAEDEKLEGVIEDAVDKDPQRGTAAVGPVSNATADELRRQRARR